MNLQFYKNSNYFIQMQSLIEKVLMVECYTRLIFDLWENLNVLAQIWVWNMNKDYLVVSLFYLANT